MSTGTLIPRQAAELRAARVIVELGLKEHTRDYAPADLLAVQIVGSIRRHKKLIGDVDLLALATEVGASTPVLTPAMDPLFMVLNQACENPWIDPKAHEERTSLFGADKLTPAPPRAPMLRAVKGLKPGFRMASLVILGRVDEPEIPLQVFRSEPAHWGWGLARATGPGELGEQLLAHWKHTQGIGREGKGSIDGRLVDANGDVVSTPTETEFFRRLGINYCWPRERDELLERIKAARARSGGGAWV